MEAVQITAETANFAGRPHSFGAITARDQKNFGTPLLADAYARPNGQDASRRKTAHFI
jgi:hypothetical protein